MILKDLEPLKICIRESRFSGVVKIKKGKTTIFDSASGYASKPFRVPNNRMTRFANASVTKMFTAVAFLALVEKGLLDLDTVVIDYLDLLDSTLSPQLKARHLLTHTSGISEYFDNTDPNGFENLWLQLPNPYIDSLSKMLPLFIDEPANALPGTHFDYSGSGYILLGLMIEKAMKTSYYEAIQTLVFDPAFMLESGFFPLQNVVDHVAEGYIPLLNASNRITGWKRNIYSIPTYGMSDGGSFSTAKDLMKFLLALRDGTLISSDSFNAMSSPHVRIGDKYSYGYGLWLEHRDDILIKYGHTGEDPGISASVYCYPTLDIDVVVLGNHSFSTNVIVTEIERIIGISP